jgi:two-component system, OmpR family, sensor histidine kinase KdpD
VCVSTNPNSVQLLRRSARIASYMNAKFYCLFVADPDRFLTKAESLYLETCQRLTEEFEGEFLRINEQNVARAIATVVREYRISQIVLGATARSRWQLLFRGSLLQRLLKQLKNVDFHIIASEKAPEN